MKRYLTLSICIMFYVTGIGQYFYLPSTTNGNPGGLNTDSEYPNGSGLPAGWDVLLAGSNSTPTWSPSDTIPFPFNFNGAPVSQFKVSSSGVLTFSTSAVLVPGYVNATIPDPGIPNSSIMVWGIEGTGSNDAIVTKLFGNAGQQQYWVFFASYTAGSWTYWSIVLEEGSDKIYIVDQRHSTNATVAITAGIQVDNSNAIMVNGSPQLSNLAGTDATPADNHYYEFTYGSQNAIDMSSIDILTYPYLYLNDAPFTITGIFRNLGIDSVYSMDVNYAINGANINTESVSNLDLNTYDNDTLDFAANWTPTAGGTYDITIWATNINGSNDLNNSNDTVHKLLHVFDTKTTRKPMLETFVSSTSSYSVTGNIDLAAILNSNPGDHTMIKYPMSWPSPGDPYYTPEGGQRRSYYSVNTVPRLVMNGVIQNNPIGLTQQEYDEAADMYAFLDLTAGYSVGGQSVHIDIQIDPLTNTAGIWNDLVLHAAVFERNTYNNTATNGEIEFYNVMKKMLPDANGTPLPDLQNGISEFFSLDYIFNGIYDLPPDADNPIDHTISHSVEDFENLGVAVWIQNNDDKYILQSTEADITFSIDENNDDFNISIYPNPASDIVYAKLASNNFQNIKVDIINILGKTIKNVNYTVNNGNLVIDTKNLSNGLYTIVFTLDDKRVISKKVNINR